MVSEHTSVACNNMLSMIGLNENSVAGIALFHLLIPERVIIIIDKLFIQLVHPDC